MVILKKVKGSTLMETLVATVLIVVVFMMASMILNGLFSSTIKNDLSHMETHLNELEYLYTNDHLSLPYQDTVEDWNVLVKKIKDRDNVIVTFEAINSKTQKTLTRNQFEIQ